MYLEGGKKQNTVVKEWKFEQIQQQLKSHNYDIQLYVCVCAMKTDLKKKSRRKYTFMK